MQHMVSQRSWSQLQQPKQFQGDTKRYLQKHQQPTCYGLDVLLNIGPQLVFDSKGLTLAEQKELGQAFPVSKPTWKNSVYGHCLNHKPTD